MTDRLILWLPDPLDGPWPWYVSPGQSGVADTPEKKAALGSLKVSEIVAILPGQWARLFAVDLPKMRPRERAVAAGFSIEDMLGSGLQGQHIALQDTERGLRAGVISNDKLTATLDALSALGLKASHVYADYDACRPQGASIALTDRVIRCGPDGFAVDHALYDSLALGPAPTDGTLDALSQGLDTREAVNFLQGAFAPKKQAMAYAPVAARAACLAACLGAVFLAWQGALAWAASQQANHLQAQTAALYQNATGKAPRGNAALAVTRALKSRQPDQTDFLTLSTILLHAVADVDAVTINMLQYDAGQDRLMVRLIYPDFAAASALEAAVTQLGGQFRPGSVREVDGQMIGDGVVTLERAR